MPVAVVYKFFDDQGGYLAAVLTHYSFLAILPLLLIASSLLGFVLQGDPKLQEEILTSALAQFPIVGDELGRPGGIQGSTSAVVVGILAATYGAIGLGQAAQNAVNVAWAIPRNSRLNPIHSRLRSLVGVVLAGLALSLVVRIRTVASQAEALNADRSFIGQRRCVPTQRNRDLPGDHAYSAADRAGGLGAARHVFRAHRHDAGVRV